MRDVNDVTVIGTIAEGYENYPAISIREGIGQNNLTVANFTVITEKPNRGGGDPWRTFIKVSCWSDLATSVQSMGAGDRVYVKGEVKNEKYEKKDGTKVNTLSINAFAVEPLFSTASQDGPSEEDKGGAFANASPAAAVFGSGQGTADGQPVHDDGLPF